MKRFCRLHSLEEVVLVIWWRQKKKKKASMTLTGNTENLCASQTQFCIFIILLLAHQRNKTITVCFQNLFAEYLHCEFMNKQYFLHQNLSSWCSMATKPFLNYGFVHNHFGKTAKILNLVFSPHPFSHSILAVSVLNHSCMLRCRSTLRLAP